MPPYTWLWCRNCERLVRTATADSFWCGPRNGQRACRPDDQDVAPNQDVISATERLGGWDAAQEMVRGWIMASRG